MLFQLFELRAEVHLFLIDINFPFQNLFCDNVWLSKLAYLADVFRFLNKLNLSLQGATVDIFQVSDKINSTVRKLQLRLRDIEKIIWLHFHFCANLFQKMICISTAN